MAGVNKVILVGNLGKDPEIRTNAAGDRIANFSIATSEQWKDRTTGEKKEKTEWHRVVIFNDNLAKIAEQYLRKGSTVYIEGSLQTRKWSDAQGVDRYATEVVLKNFNGTMTLIGVRRDGDSPPPAGSPDDYGQASTRGAGGRTEEEMRQQFDLNDEIPF